MASQENDWIEWAGGSCPIPHRVQVRLRNGTEQTWDLNSFCDDGDWGHYPYDADGDVVAYRVVL